MSETNLTTEQIEQDFYILAWGLAYASVCTSLDDNATTARLNAELPTGITSRWQICDEPTFAEGQTNPHPCPGNNPGHRHVLYNC